MKRFLPLVVTLLPVVLFLGARGPAALPASDPKMATPRYDKKNKLCVAVEFWLLSIAQALTYI